MSHRNREFIVSYNGASLGASKPLIQVVGPPRGKIRVRGLLLSTDTAATLTLAESALPSTPTTAVQWKDPSYNDPFELLKQSAFVNFTNVPANNGTILVAGKTFTFKTSTPPADSDPTYYVDISGLATAALVAKAFGKKVASILGATGLNLATADFTAGSALVGLHGIGQGVNATALLAAGTASNCTLYPALVTIFTAAGTLASGTTLLALPLAAKAPIYVPLCPPSDGIGREYTNGASLGLYCSLAAGSEVLTAAMYCEHLDSGQ